jgi:hypothetical protein
VELKQLVFVKVIKKPAAYATGLLRGKLYLGYI